VNGSDRRKVPIGNYFHAIGIRLATRGSFVKLLQDEIDSLNLRRLANDFGNRLQAQRTAEHES
jgi:hypothetical protein